MKTCERLCVNQPSSHWRLAKRSRTRESRRYDRIVKTKLGTERTVPLADVTHGENIRVLQSLLRNEVALL